MSGIYIKGMEMPNGCAFCKIKRRNGGKMVCPLCNEEWDIRDPMSADFRMDLCPLTPVPPHGRLIDADALTETFRERKRPTLSDGADGSKERVRYLDFISAIQTIKETPTIIPSELRKKSGKNP